VPVDLALLDALLQVGGHGRQPALERAGIEVEQARLDAAQRQRLGDPVPHGPRAEHRRRPDLVCLHSDCPLLPGHDPGTSTSLPST
jgi:hypothetical protein